MTNAMEGKLRAVPARRGSEFSFVAPKPALSGKPGERTAECVDARVQRRGNKTQLVLTLDTEDGQVGHMWIDIPQPLTSTCRYVRLATLALGRTPLAGEPIHPESAGLFRGKRFRVMVGWRKSERDARGKHRFDEALALEGPKDSRDFLRVHDLLERVDP
jgi:hypothetical protein